MIPVPSYELISFLSWLSQRGFQLSTDSRSERLRSLALEFLRRPGNRALNTLAGLMVIFQECPMICEPDFEKQIEHFTGCGRCIRYISEGGRQGPRRSLRLPIYREPGRNQIALHPLLQNFVEWARNSELEWRLPEAPGLDRFEQSADEFSDLIDRVGGQIREQFLRYLFEVSERHPELIDNYLLWRRSGGDRGRGEHPFRAEESTRPLGLNESVEQAAQRLADSVRLLTDSAFYDKRIAEEPRFLHLMRSLGTDNLAQALAFLSWLRAREPTLAVTGNIPAAELEKLILQFCEERGYANGLSFSKETKRWLSGAGSAGVAGRIASFLGIKRRAKLPDGFPAPHNPLDRYGAVRYHGLFLFLSSGDFPAFIEDHWRDLHHLTGDDLDIYFSEKDLSERSSGYELVAKLKEVQLRVDALPALLLWEDRLDGSVTVPLQGLEHGQIIDVMKAVVQGIRNGCTLSAIADRGTECAERIRNCVDHGVLIQRGATLLINNGGVMTEYKNYGQAGAFGEKPRSDNNRFLQSAPSEPIDLDELAKQLGQVREEMKRTANPDDADQDTEIGLLAQAEKAAKSGDRSRTLEFLKSAGNWTVEVAKSAAAGLVKDAVEGKFGS